MGDVEISDRERATGKPAIRRLVMPNFPIAKLVMKGPASNTNSITQPGATPGCFALMCLCQLSRLLLEKEQPTTPMAEQAYTDSAEAKSSGCIAFS
jgi:hypothetical protein